VALKISIDLLFPLMVVEVLGGIYANSLPFHRCCHLLTECGGFALSLSHCNATARGSDQFTLMASIERRLLAPWHPFSTDLVLVGAIGYQSIVRFTP